MHVDRDHYPIDLFFPEVPVKRGGRFHLRGRMAYHRIDEGASRREGRSIAQSVCLSHDGKSGSGVFARCRERATSMIYRVLKKLKENMDDLRSQVRSM